MQWQKKLNLIRCAAGYAGNGNASFVVSCGVFVESSLNGCSMANCSHRAEHQQSLESGHWWKIHFHLLFIRKYFDSSWACASGSQSAQQSSCLGSKFESGSGSSVGQKSVDKRQWQSQTEQKDTRLDDCELFALAFAFVIIVRKSYTRHAPCLCLPLIACRGRMFVLRLVELISVAQPSRTNNKY